MRAPSCFAIWSCRFRLRRAATRWVGLGMSRPTRGCSSPNSSEGVALAGGNSVLATREGRASTEPTASANLGSGR